jgi:hypothetical protein
MNIIRGVVAMLGYTHVRRSTVVYSVVEVGDQIVSEMSVPKPLVKYLTRAFRNAANANLYLVHDRLIGIQTNEAAPNYHSYSRLTALLFVLLSVAMIPLLGLGLLLLGPSIRQLKYAQAGATLAQQGGLRAN